jgi:hypothetical protein
LHNSVAANTLKYAFEGLKETLDRHLVDLRNDQQPATTEREAILTKAINDAELVGKLIRDFYDLIYRETATLENTLTFAMPLFPVDVVKDLHELRQLFIDYRGRLQDMLGVIAGESEASVIVRAKHTVLDFQKLEDKVNILARSSMVEDDVRIMTHVSSLLKVLPYHNQVIFSEMLVDVFEEARKRDAQLKAARR